MRAAPARRPVSSRRRRRGAPGEKPERPGAVLFVLLAFAGAAAQGCAAVGAAGTLAEGAVGAAGDALEGAADAAGDALEGAADAATTSDEERMKRDRKRARRKRERAGEKTASGLERS